MVGSCNVFMVNYEPRYPILYPHWALGRAVCYLACFGELLTDNQSQNCSLICDYTSRYSHRPARYNGDIFCRSTLIKKIHQTDEMLLHRQNCPGAYHSCPNAERYSNHKWTIHDLSKTLSRPKAPVLVPKTKER